MADLQKTIKGLRCHSEPKFVPDEYFCETCPYDEATCGLDVPNDALSLLKAQEPKVMTKEEIIGWDGYIWFEFRGMRAMKVVLIDHGMVREPFRGDYPTKELSWGICQETWRAWTAMPTKEQREAVMWTN